MSIVLPEGLPAVATLRSEGIEISTRRGSRCGRAGTLRVALLNLMPDKITTETQIARLLGATPLQTHLTLVIPDSCSPKNTSVDHISSFYERWSEVRAWHFDGLIITGAPVEHLPFEQVAYWRELKEILDWSGRHAHHSLLICWAAQAALYHFYGIPKRKLGQKAFGVFPQWVTQPDTPLLRGFGIDFMVPVSRHTEVSANDLPADSGLRILARSCESGLCLLEDSTRDACYMFNHFEYDSGTLAQEYARDLARGDAISCPFGYGLEDGPGHASVDYWRFHARLFFQNWANEIARAQTSSGLRVNQSRAVTGCSRF